MSYLDGTLQVLHSKLLAVKEEPAFLKAEGGQQWHFLLGRTSVQAPAIGLFFVGQFMTKEQDGVVIPLMRKHSDFGLKTSRTE